MEYFVKQDSVVRSIWGNGDTVLFIFAGASAEFALNKAVDWLYFTGRLPADPIGRLFSTVSYSQQIIFAEKDNALKAIDKITMIHAGVEASRGATIPDWAYRDVLFMLIHYSIASFELLQRKLTDTEKDEVFDVFYRVGARMKLKGLPTNFKEWVVMHKAHLQDDLVKSNYTVNLYEQYKKHLGSLRYSILIASQILVVPQRVNELLDLGKYSWLTPVLFTYKLSRYIKLDWLLKSLVLPTKYRKQIKDLDTV